MEPTFSSIIGVPNSNAGAVLMTPAGTTPKEFASMPTHTNPNRICPQCGGSKSWEAPKCIGCYKAENAFRYVCPQCGGPKGYGSKLCRTCHVGERKLSETCGSCGGPMQRKRRGGLCLACYKRNGRLDPVHRDDGSTLLPLPHGKFATIDTEGFDRVKDYSWHLSGNGYVLAIMPDRKKRGHFLLHRVIMDAGPLDVVDHRDHDLLNNRKTNLLLGTQTENMHNVAPRKGRKYRGVFLRKDTGRFKASIGHRNQSYALGDFETPQEAARAYNVAALRLYGDRAVLNDVEVN